jgi:predicted O-linked N-acetylglucosamine transferase (SPINDLY family)
MTDTALTPAAEALSALQLALLTHNDRTWSDEEASLRAALARDPRHANALRSLGLIAAGQGFVAESVLWFRAALEADPAVAQAHVDLGIALRQQGQQDEAQAQFELAARLDPGNRELQLMAQLQRACALDEQGRFEDALAVYLGCIEQHPESADAWASLGVLQRHLGHLEAAAASLSRALQIEPSRLDVIEQFGMSLQDQRLHEDASLAFERLLQLDPERPLTAGRLMHVKMLGADWTALGALYQRIATDTAAGRLAAEPFGLQGYCPAPQLLRMAAQKYAGTYVPKRADEWPPARVGTGPEIRVGYVAGEFRNQATSILLTEVLECHDRSKFEVFAFDNGWDDQSALRRRIEAATQVVPIRWLDHRSAVTAVRDRGIDILVNLNGYFGRARHHLFAARPAAVQVNYLGFPGTTGMPFIDYLIADEVVIPPDAHAHYTEKVVYLPDSYQPNDSQRQVAAIPATRTEAGLPDDAFVFCCMNNVYKIMPAVFDVWMRLLQRVPGSVLMLYSNTPETQDNLRHEAAARRVDPSRLIFGAPLPNDQHLARLRLCDLFLDTLPYNAHTTGSDALWAGLPVLTCMGQTFPSRVGASLLQAVGLPELITPSLADYESLAIRLATEPGLLVGLRQKLSTQLRSAPLYDTRRYTRHLEAAYSHMVERARQGLAAAAFAVAPQK